MNALTAQKYRDSQREADLREVAAILDRRQTCDLSDACDIVGIDPHSLTKQEIEFIKEFVD